MKEILRNLGLAALVILFFILQTVFGEKLTLWGVKPEVLPFAAAAIGVLSGKTAGAWLGFLGGLLARITPVEVPQDAVRAGDTCRILQCLEGG